MNITLLYCLITPLIYTCEQCSATRQTLDLWLLEPRMKYYKSALKKIQGTQRDAWDWLKFSEINVTHVSGLLSVQRALCFSEGALRAFEDHLPPRLHISLTQRRQRTTMPTDFKCGSWRCDKEAAVTPRLSCDSQMSLGYQGQNVPNVRERTSSLRLESVMMFIRMLKRRTMLLEAISPALICLHYLYGTRQIIYPDSLIVICGVIIIIYHQEGQNDVTACDLTNETRNLLCGGPVIPTCLYCVYVPYFFYFVSLDDFGDDLWYTTALAKSLCAMYASLLDASVSHEHASIHSWGNS